MPIERVLNGTPGAILMRSESLFGLSRVLLTFDDDADSFKANRDREMKASAAKAIDSVRTTGKPYAFPPMTSRERRLLHLALQESGLPTASSGEMPRRFVVLYPEGYDPATRNQPGQTQRGQGSDASSVPVGDRVHAVRSSFRRR